MSWYVPHSSFLPFPLCAEFLLSSVTSYKTIVKAAMALLSLDFPLLNSVDLRSVPGCPLVPFLETPGDACKCRQISRSMLTRPLTDCLRWTSRISPHVPLRGFKGLSLGFTRSSASGGSSYVPCVPLFRPPRNSWCTARNTSLTSLPA